MKSKRKGMGSHQSAKMDKDEWLTPPHVLKAFPTFDLDPCAPIIRPWDTAKKHYTIIDDGLKQLWSGRVWCNPPYGKQAAVWMNRMVEHRNGIALLYARTETNMFFDSVWDNADAILFIKGRLFFHHVDGLIAEHNGGAPSVLIAYGKSNVELLKNCPIEGKFITL